MIHVVTHGKILTDKHFLLGLGIHNITGQKRTLQIINMHGHCIDYNKVCKVAATHSWADNSNMDVETPDRKGSIHSTRMIAFQEKSESSVLYSKAVNIPRSRKRSIDYLPPKDYKTLYVNQKAEPPVSFTDSQQSSSLD